MGAAKVRLSEITKDTRVPSFPGPYCGIAVPTLKGPVNTPFLSTSEAQFLKKFTPNEKIEVGMDVSHHSVIAAHYGTNKIWVVRAANASLYGGVAMVEIDAAGANVGVSAGIDVPTDYSFAANDTFLLVGTNQGVWNNELSVKLTNPSTGSGASTWAADTVTAVGDKVVPQSVNGYYYECTSLLGSPTQTASPEPTWPIVVGTTVDDGTVRWTCKSVLAETNAQMQLEVYDGTTLVETWFATRIAGTKDGFGQSLYIEDVLNASEYIIAINNVAVDEAIITKEQTTTLAFVEGDDGIAVTSGEMITAIQTLQNKEAYQLTIVMDGGYTVEAYQNALITMCEARQDCVFVLSVPYAKEASADYLNEIVAYRTTDLNPNSSYGAMFSPHIKTYDKANDRYLYTSPDGHAAAAICKTAANQEMWYPIGGFRRGVLNVLDLRRRFSQGEMDLLADNGINPLRFAPGRGILLWGQKTLSSRPTALDRLNVRLMLIVIEPSIMEALEDFMFELNTVETRSLVSVMINSYMENIKARDGVTDFTVICDDTNNTPEDIDNYRLNVDLYVQPTKSIEDIRFSVIITRTGATVTAG